MSTPKWVLLGPARLVPARLACDLSDRNQTGSWLTWLGPGSADVLVMANLTMKGQSCESLQHKGSCPLLSAHLL